MIRQNESCSAEQIPMSYLTCLLYVLEGWSGVEHLNYVVYLLWLFSPLLVAFILPGLVIIILYVNIIILHIYKRRTDLKEAYSNDFWDGARQVLATIWHGHARIWNGYEVYGLENIPDGPAVMVFYHGATPLDFFYLTATLIIRKKRIFHVVADHFVFSLPELLSKYKCKEAKSQKVPKKIVWFVHPSVPIQSCYANSFQGFKLLLDVFNVLHGSQEECVAALKKGYLLAIAPGGVREALFSNENYSLMWGNRKGFAQVAIDAKVPIIPMFTQNVREGIRTLGGLKLLRVVYENFRLPIVPVYGNFPVKLRTYIGDPIPYEPNVTAVELAEKAKNAVQSLIDKHQKIPGNVFRSLMERFDIWKKKD